MPPLLQLMTYLSPAKGPVLVLRDNETWIGRNSFELSEKAQLLCSRRQACLKVNDTAVTLECHGLNPVYFVVCHSVNFKASEDTPPSRLHHLKRGEAVELVDGDKFFLAPKECLLTVGIKSSNSEVNEAAAAAVQLTPDDVHFNLQDDRSLADQICSPKATQLGPVLANSPVQQHRPLQTGVPGNGLPTEVPINLDDRGITRKRGNSNPSLHNCLVYPSDENCKCNDVRNPPSGREGPLVKEVHQVDDSKCAKSGDPAPPEFVVDTRRSTVDESKATVVSYEGQSPELLRLDSFGAEDPVNVIHEVTQAAGSSLEGVRGSGNDPSKAILPQSIHPDTLNCGLESTFPSEAIVTNHPGAEGASKQITSRIVYGPTVSPPLAASGDPYLDEVVTNTRTLVSGSKTAIVPEDRNVAEFLRQHPSGTGGGPTSTQEGCTLAATNSVEGRVRAHSSSSDSPGKIFAQRIHPDTTECGLGSRGPAEPVVNSHLDAHNADQNIGTRDISGDTSSLSPELSQVQNDMPSAVISCLDPRQGPLLRRQLSPLQGNNIKADSSAVSVPGPQSPPRDCVSTGLPMTIDERRAVLLKQPEIVDLTGPEETIDERRVLLPKQPEIVDLTGPEDRRDAQAQIRSDSVQTHHTLCNTYGKGPIEGMKNVIVTISGYPDPLRARLINLISATGASYTGSLTKMNTHVVCWKFVGGKYEMAKKLGKIIINHCWFENCQKAGRRLPEEAYKASGEMAEPLRWDLSSAVQHPSSTLGFCHDDDCNPLQLGEHSLGQTRRALVIGGPSTHSGIRGEPSCRSALLSRNENDMLDRGKRHVDLSSSAKWLEGGNLGTMTHACQDSPQIRPSISNGNSLATDLSTSHRAQEQDSDDFWNEAIREYDEKNNQVTEHTCQVVSKANHRAGLTEHKTLITRNAASPVPGSSLRERDPEVHDKIRSGRRNDIAHEAGSSRVAQGVILQEAEPLHSVVGEQSDHLQRETDHTTPRYPEVFQRKRKHASAIAKISSAKGKHPRLARNSVASSVSGGSPNQVGSVASYMEGVKVAGQQTLNSGAPQERASTVDKKENFKQRAGVIDAESVDKALEKGGELQSSSEIVCVICHSDTKPVTEGVLSCGHQFCYPCIQRWADEGKSKSPTCPLCKLPFDYITFREMGKPGADGSCAVLDERIVQIGHQILEETRFTNMPSLRTENLCVTCGSRDTSELLLICTHCRERACHTFCLDPPRPPGSFWFCSRCSQMHSRMQTREAYGRLFQGSSPQLAARRRQDIPDLGMNLAPQSRTGFGALVTHQPSATPHRTNLAQQSGSITHIGAMALGQSSTTPHRMNLAQQSGSITHIGAMALGQSSDTPRRRGRQNSLYNFLVRQNDV